MEHPKKCRHWGAPHSQQCAPQWVTPQPHPAPQPDPELVNEYSNLPRPGPAYLHSTTQADSSLRERMLRNTQEQFSRTNSTTHHTYRPQAPKTAPQVARNATTATTAELDGALDLRKSNDAREAALLERLRNLEK